MTRSARVALEELMLTMVQNEHRTASFETTDFDLPYFPTSHHLVITTSRHVYSCDDSGVTQIFRSGSGGIVAAKRAKDGSGMLAVADSQVVVLHDIKKGQQRSYRLKGAEVMLTAHPPTYVGADRGCRAVSDYYNTPTTLRVYTLLLPFRTRSNPIHFDNPVFWTLHMFILHRRHALHYLLLLIS